MDFKLDSKKRQISTSDGAGYLAAGAQLGGVHWEQMLGVEPKSHTSTFG